jgi:hypothetical protein
MKRKLFGRFKGSRSDRKVVQPTVGYSTQFTKVELETIVSALTWLHVTENVWKQNDISYKQNLMPIVRKALKTLR